MRCDDRRVRHLRRVSSGAASRQDTLERVRTDAGEQRPARFEA